MRNANGLKRMRTAGVLLCGAVLAIVPALAQDDAAPPPPPQGQTQGLPMGGPGGRAGMDPAHRLEKMQQELNLTADQTTAIKAIFKDGRAKVEALRANTALTPQDQHAQMRTLREEENTKIKAVLTPDQVTKFEAMEAQARGHRGGGNAPPPAEPQQ